MKKIYILLISLILSFSLNSCETYTSVTTQDDIYVETNVDIVPVTESFDVIIKYGTPFYKNEVILYYLYGGIYYYPYYYNDYWYVRAYRKPFTHFDNRPYFRPHKYDYRVRPSHYKKFGLVNHRHYNRPYVRYPDRYSQKPRHGNYNHRPNHSPNRKNNHRMGGKR